MQLLRSTFLNLNLTVHSHRDVEHTLLKRLHVYILFKYRYLASNYFTILHHKVHRTHSEHKAHKLICYGKKTGFDVSPS